LKVDKEKIRIIRRQANGHQKNGGGNHYCRDLSMLGDWTDIPDETRQMLSSGVLAVLSGDHFLTGNAKNN